MKPQARHALAVALAAATAWACAPPARVEPRLVLLYATCTVHRDLVSPYDPRVGYTPHLARLAEDSAVFLRHHTEAGQSGLAYASILTGRQADGHGVYQIPQRLPDEAVLISEAFREAGWEVYAWLGHPMASVELNYGQGVPASQRFDRRLEADDPAFQELLAGLARDPGRRALVFTSFTVTHGPYDATALGPFCAERPARCEALGEPRTLAEHLERYRADDLRLSFDFPATRRRWGLSDADVEQLAVELETVYRANLRRLDRMFGRVVEAIQTAGLRDASLIAFTADHGEALDPDGAVFPWSHSFQLGPDVIRVPLLIRGPAAGVRPARLDFVTRSIDVFPTLAGLVGVPLPAGVEGVDLAPVLRGEAEPPELLAFSHTSVLSPTVERLSRRWTRFRRVVPSRNPTLMWASVRRGDLAWRLQRLDEHGFEVVAYDWRRDPREQRDLFDPDSPEHRRMAEALRAYKARLVRAYVAGRAVGPRREEELLRSLGYVE